MYSLQGGLQGINGGLHNLQSGLQGSYQGALQGNYQGALQGNYQGSFPGGLQGGLGQLNLGTGWQAQVPRGAGLASAANTALNRTAAELDPGSLGKWGINSAAVLGTGLSSQNVTSTGPIISHGFQGLSMMASAPMLPILGEDLAKPNSQTQSQPQVQTSAGQPPTQVSTLTASTTHTPIENQEDPTAPNLIQIQNPSDINGAGTVNISGAPASLKSLQPNASAVLSAAASLDSSSVKSSDTVLTVSSAATGPSKSISTTSSMDVKMGVTDGDPAVSVPNTIGASDVSNRAEPNVSPLLSDQTDDIRLLAAQFGLLGQQGAGSPPGVSNGQAIGLPASSIAQIGGARSGVHRERDFSTLKTLGQMLARTGHTVESAVQTGLLGGCNAEDVKVVSEAYTVELAGMKRQEQVAKLGTVLSLDLSDKGVHLGTSVALPRTSENATELSLPIVSLSPTVGVGVVGDKRGMPLLNSAIPTPIGPSLTPTPIAPPAEEEEDDEPDWDKVFENEEDLIPSHVISAVNEETLDQLLANVGTPAEDAFNAFSYGFFANNSDGDLDDVLEGIDNGEPEKEEATNDVGNEQNAVLEDADEKEDIMKQPTKESLNNKDHNDKKNVIMNQSTKDDQYTEGLDEEVCASLV